ncbi:arabinan endo-1,5-alpha-L-arabinosidase [Capsulimonas corticalis]|uniref:Arabinan endo-1,5-alpha-L-arabinosidase n=1 Tax=Capsulimonas corticalis TaxID=2219043 RepID=A0A402D3T1_9BACT|nr:arabinan endo-1,5-alpha-L-arabinosidase [Capsulimonas corticalis]BDI29703.1 arabinan endo-1,5-alpha-L-arabinosidase [Capsulimonas corticalis]
MNVSILHGHRKTSSRLHIFARLTLAILLWMVMAFAGSPARATNGANGIHDPSSIVKIGSLYHIWGTGQGIIHKTSPDMVTWTDVGSVFGSGNGPSWIQTYVPGFKGFFWAPEIVWQGGKWFLYYACSLGAKPCCIGCATSSDGYNWSDQGMVVYSDNNTVYGSIDPFIWSGWVGWGSHLTGIWISPVNTSTGKLTGSKTNIINISDAEGANIIWNGGYFYCFYQRGVCCNGVNSTYTMWVARATSITGPYSGNRVFMSGSNPYYGPGQAGFWASVISYHYYDGNNNGAPTLGVSNLTFSGGWPSWNSHY